MKLMQIKYSREALESAIVQEKVAADRVLVASGAFGHQVRLTRDTLSLTLRTAAAALRISPTYLSHLETGKRTWPSPLANAAVTLLTTMCKPTPQ
jgi:predicted transcriptional regulator